MSLHHPDALPKLDPILRQSLDALGLPAVAPEPEVLRADLSRIQCKSLAGIIAGLINDSEPLLNAEADGATVTVRERGGPAVMVVTIAGAKS